MLRDWQDISKFIKGKDVIIERVRIVDDDIAIEGRFSLPHLIRLSSDDQIFIAAFVRCHGSIKQMEKYFGVSYPTIKNRLNRISESLSFIEIEPAPESVEPNKLDILEKIERGELTVDEAIHQIHKGA